MREGDERDGALTSYGIGHSYTTQRKKYEHPLGRFHSCKFEHVKKDELFTRMLFHLGRYCGTPPAYGVAYLNHCRPAEGI